MSVFPLVTMSHHSLCPHRSVSRPTLIIGGPGPVSDVRCHAHITRLVTECHRYPPLLRSEERQLKCYALIKKKTSNSSRRREINLCQDYFCKLCNQFNETQFNLVSLKATNSVVTLSRRTSHGLSPGYSWHLNSFRPLSRLLLSSWPLTPPPGRAGACS